MGAKTKKGIVRFRILKKLLESFPSVCYIGPALKLIQKTVKGEARPSTREKVLTVKRLASIARHVHNYAPIALIRTVI